MVTAEGIRAGAFDIDGTLRTKQDGVPEEVKLGMEALWNEGVVTTIVTGRGLSRAREVLGSDFPKLISPQAPLSLENGGRLATQDGINLLYHPLTQSDVDGALDLIRDGREKEVRFVAYYPKDTDRKVVLWVPDSETAAQYHEKYGYFADVTAEPLINIGRRMLADEACMLMVNPHDPAFKAEFDEKGLNVAINDGELNIMKHNVHKGQGVRDVAEVLGVPLHEVLIGGNDNNDDPMFAIPEVRKIFVEGPMSGFVTVPADAVRVDSPRGLGLYLQQIAKR